MYLPLNPVLPLLVSEVGKGDEEDEDDEAHGERDEERHVVDGGVQGRAALLPRLRGGRVHRRQLLVAQVVVPTTGYGSVSRKE